MESFIYFFITIKHLGLNHGYQEIFIVLIILYMIGSIPFSIIISKVIGLEDPRNYGSENPGATNVMRSGNKIAAISTLVGDFFKGYIPIYYLYNHHAYTLEDVWILSFIIILGHIYSIFLSFHGGKGVATSLGVILAIDFNIGCLLLITWIAVFYITRISGLSALISFLVFPFFINNILGSHLLSFAILNTILIFASHRKNISEFLISLKR